MVFRKDKSVEQALEEHSHSHSSENEIKCTGKDCLGKEDHIMKSAGKNKVKCSSCGEERILVKPHEGLKECPHCGESFPGRKTFDICPYCDKEV